jgi:hypothetical protein
VRLGPGRAVISWAGRPGYTLALLKNFFTGTRYAAIAGIVALSDSLNPNNPPSLFRQGLFFPSG